MDDVLLILIISLIGAFVCMYFYYLEVRPNKGFTKIDIFLETPDFDVDDLFHHMISVAMRKSHPDYAYSIITIDIERDGVMKKYPVIRLHFGERTRDFMKIVKMVEEFSTEDVILRKHY